MTLTHRPNHTAKRAKFARKRFFIFSVSCSQNPYFWIRFPAYEQRTLVSHLTCFPPNCHLFSLLLSGFGVRVCSFPFRGLSFLFHPAFRLSVRCVSPRLAFPSIFPALEKCTVPVRPFGLSVTIEYHVSPWLNIYFCCKHMDKICKNFKNIENIDISLKIIFWQGCDRIVKNI